MTIYVAKMQRYKNCNLNKNLNYLNFWFKYFFTAESNLLIRTPAAFFAVKIMLVTWLSSNLFYLSYLSSKMWEVLLKCACVKQDRRSMYSIHDENSNPWLSRFLAAFSCGSYRNTVYVNVFLTYSYQVVKSISY